MQASDRLNGSIPEMGNATIIDSDRFLSTKTRNSGARFGACWNWNLLHFLAMLCNGDLLYNYL